MRENDVRKVGDWELSAVARRTLQGRKYYVVGVCGGIRYQRQYDSHHYG